jgi:hypothetical protein
VEAPERDALSAAVVLRPHCRVRFGYDEEVGCVVGGALIERAVAVFCFESHADGTERAYGWSVTNEDREIEQQHVTLGGDAGTPNQTTDASRPMGFTGGSKRVGEPRGGRCR